MGPWDDLEGSWPLERLRNDALRLNDEFGLTAGVQLVADANPSFLVGWLRPSSRCLVIGMNPRRNSDDEKWRHVVEAVNVPSFPTYRRNAENYFLDPTRFNGQHYDLTAKVVAAALRIPEPGDSEARRYLLHDTVVQVELVPFASQENGLTASDVLAFQSRYESGRLAANVLDSVMQQTLWDLVVVRGLRAPWEVIEQRLGAESVQWIPGVGGVARARANGRDLPIIGITNRGRLGAPDVRRLCELARTATG